MQLLTKWGKIEHTHVEQYNIAHTMTEITHLYFSYY